MKAINADALKDKINRIRGGAEMAKDKNVVRFCTFVLQEIDRMPGVPMKSDWDNCGHCVQFIDGYCFLKAGQPRFVGQYGDSCKDFKQH